MRTLLEQIFCRHIVVLVAVSVVNVQVGMPVTFAEESSDTLDLVVKKAAASVVRIANAERVCCLGTLVADGYVVTKSSELSGPLTCAAADGALARGSVVAVSKELDLALISIDPNGAERPFLKSFAQPIEFERPAEFGGLVLVEAGDVLISVGNKPEPLAIGMASVDPQVIAIKQPACRDCVDLGVAVAAESSTQSLAGGDLIQADSPSGFVTGVRVERVYPRTVAEEVGLLKNDLLLSINGWPVHDANSLRQAAFGLRVGQRLRVWVVRSGQRKELALTIKGFSRRVVHDRWGGGPFSERRFGFGKTIVHDTLIRPDQCGGPLVDLDGNFVGINIARSLRVATLAVSADQVRAFLKAVKPSLVP